MKYIGILMMAGALAAGGFWAADQWKEKLELLLLFRQMMFYLKGQILYANATAGSVSGGGRTVRRGPERFS